MKDEETTQSPDEVSIDTAAADTATDSQTDETVIDNLTPDENESVVDAPKPLQADQAIAVESKKPKGSKKNQLMVLVVLLLLAVGGAVYWFVLKDSSSSSAPATEQVDNSQEQPVAEDEALQKFIKPTTGETWLATPKKISAQDYFSDEFGGDMTYYQVGSRAGKSINMVIWCPLGCNVMLFEVAADGSVAYIARPDSQAVYNQDDETSQKSNIKSSIAFDTTIHYDSLSMPASLEIEHGYKVTKPVYPSQGEPIQDYTGENKPMFSDVKTYGSSKLVKSETSYTDTNLTSIGYALITPLGTRVWLAYEPVPVSMSGYKWSVGNSISSDKLKAIARGCGGGLSSSITRSDVVKDADVQVVGKSSDGQDIYELKDTNNPLITKAYQEFIDYTATDSSAPYAGISKVDFVKEHGLVLAKDKFGQWLVFTREQLSPAYGCAKPVVYLYPTEATHVDVQVGADVKVSDPLYPAATGWQNVLAQPDGRLTYQGQQYNSLFWEGPGYGQYPAVTSGTVVKRSEAVSTIRSQLAQQGLNRREIDDFMEYWQDKLPNKPYVRLTWFTTAQLNQLAPLRITPKPDTVIRVFLDFAGLDAPMRLPAQQLTAVPRQGFTVVEWGGLSPTKLY